MRTAKPRRDLPRCIRRSRILCVLAMGSRTNNCAARRRWHASSACPSPATSDYAVGANPSGSETWADQNSYRMGAEIWCAGRIRWPLKGQGWGIPPQDPHQMLAQRLQGFATLIRNNMRYYGAYAPFRSCDGACSGLWWLRPGSRPLRVLRSLSLCSSAHGIVAGKRARRLLGRGEDLAWFRMKCAGAMPNAASTTTRCCCSKRWTADSGVR